MNVKSWKCEQTSFINQVTADSDVPISAHFTAKFTQLLSYEWPVQSQANSNQSMYVTAIDLVT